MTQHSLVAMFLDADVVEDAAVEVIENISAGISVSQAFTGFEQHFNRPLSSLDIHRYVGLVLVDGLSGAEDQLMEKLGDRTDLSFVGGSAGDDLKFQRTQVLLDGKAYTDAALLVLLRLRNGFDIVKTQSCASTGHVLTATRVDELHRTVLQFNHKPALEAYAEALDVPVEQASASFPHHPLGLMIGDEPFVRSPQSTQDGSIRFYCQIREGTELEVLNTRDIVADTGAAVQAQRLSGEIVGLIDFNCILRTLQLRAESQCDRYGAVFAGIPSIGFATYGEEYLGHMNQTSTMLLFR
jgi:hypothetical protein